MRHHLVAAALATFGFAAPLIAQEFPLTIEHRFGTTTIPAKPERIASVDYDGHDNLLALGVQPVVTRYWYGEHPYGIWGWAEPYFRSEPVLLKGNLDFEAIAAAEPEIIIALYSGIDQSVYEKLSLIAPVVAVPEGVADYGMEWDKKALLTGRAIGLESEAKAQIQAIKNKLSVAADAHPEWQGKTMAIGAAWSEEISAYTSKDVRSRLLGQLGFVTTSEVEALAANNPNEYHVRISSEDPMPIDADLLIWVTSKDEQVEQIRALPMYPFLKAAREGREVILDVETTAAFSFASLISLPHAIDTMLPAIEAALKERTRSVKSQ